MNAGSKKPITMMIVILGLLALVALVASSWVNPARLDDVIGKPAVDQSRPAIVWRF